MTQGVCGGKTASIGNKNRIYICQVVINLVLRFLIEIYILPSSLTCEDYQKKYSLWVKRCVWHRNLHIRHLILNTTVWHISYGLSIMTAYCLALYIWIYCNCVYFNNGDILQ